MLRNLSDTTATRCSGDYWYYLPAFLRWVLRHLGDPNDDHRQDNPVNWSLGHGLTARFELLDGRQHRAVCLFLRHL